MIKLNFLSLSCFLLIFLFSGCASNQKAIIKYREMVQKKDYKSALEMMKGDSIYKDQESQLLKFVELGTLHLQSGEYYQALLNFDKARELSDKLFTVSVSKKIVGTIGNESSDNYYGERFERSLIRYYTILAHYNLYDKGEYEAYIDVQKDNSGKILATKSVPAVILDESKKRFHFIAAKSVLLEWNSILEDFKKTTAGEVTYKDDLLAKLVGAVLHLKADTTTDRQVAFNLLKESKNTVLKYYNSYQSFNSKFKDFNKDYSKLPEMKPELMLSTYVAATPLNNLVNSYTDDLIKTWSKSEKEQDNVYLVWHEGMISSKEIKKYDFPIGLTSATVKVGTVNDFVGFALQALVVVDAVSPKISFELPTIPYRPNNEELTFVVKKDGKNVGEKSGVLVDPLSEMAYYTLDAKATSNLATKGARVAAKHLTALVASYATYKALKEKMGDGIALLSGVASYNLAARGIQESERADLRSWLTLPNQVRMNSFKLEPGDYDFYSLNPVTKVENLVGKFKVSGNEKILLKTFF